MGVWVCVGMGVWVCGYGCVGMGVCVCVGGVWVCGHGRVCVCGRVCVGVSNHIYSVPYGVYSRAQTHSPYPVCSQVRSPPDLNHLPAVSE